MIVRIDIERDSIGRPSGGAEVEFQTHEDALEAMKRDRQHIGMTWDLYTLSSDCSNWFFCL